jgi:hypothetical protein
MHKLVGGRNMQAESGWARTEVGIQSATGHLHLSLASDGTRETRASDETRVQCSWRYGLTLCCGVQTLNVRPAAHLPLCRTGNAGGRHVSKSGNGAGCRRTHVWRSKCLQVQCRSEFAHCCTASRGQHTFVAQSQRLQCLHVSDRRCAYPQRIAVNNPLHRP